MYYLLSQEHWSPEWKKGGERRQPTYHPLRLGTICVQQSNIGTVLRATLWRLLRDRVERVWAFPQATWHLELKLKLKLILKLYACLDIPVPVWQVRCRCGGGWYGVSSGKQGWSMQHYWLTYFLPYIFSERWIFCCVPAVLVFTHMSLRTCAFWTSVQTVLLGEAS